MADYRISALVVATVDLGVHPGVTPDAAEVAAMADVNTQHAVRTLLCPCCATRLQDLEIEHVMSEPVAAASAGAP